MPLTIPTRHPPKNGKGSAIEPRDIIPWKAFPTSVFPSVIADFIESAASSSGADKSLVALPLLSGLGAAIGTTRAIRLRPGWLEFPTLWTVGISESGSGKSPAFRKAVQPLRTIQGRWFADYSQSVREYESDKLIYERERDAWRKSKSDSDPPEKPEEPRAKQILISDITTEGVASVLEHNPRGLLLASDELARWFGSFDRYAGSKGSDAPHWCEFHSAEQVVINRKGSRVLYLPRASVALTGTIQPGIMKKLASDETRASGLLARFLTSLPPRQVKRWNPREEENGSEVFVERIFERLLGLTWSTEGVLDPIVIALDDGATEAWGRWYNAHNEESADLEGDLSAAMSKLEAATARLILVLHLAGWAASRKATEPSVIIQQTVEDAVVLGEWFKHEARRFYALLTENPDDRQARRLIDWISRRGGSISENDLRRSGPKPWRGNLDQSARSLQGLVTSGIGRWDSVDPSPQGGRPTRIFRLNQGDPLIRNPQKPQENEGFSIVSKENEPEFVLAEEVEDDLYPSTVGVDTEVEEAWFDEI